MFYTKRLAVADRRFIAVNGTISSTRKRNINNLLNNSCHI